MIRAQPSLVPPVVQIPASSVSKPSLKAGGPYAGTALSTLEPGAARSTVVRPKLENSVSRSNWSLAATQTRFTSE